ncbi:DUF975 family protein [Hespellia stercorisuis]|uniref:DUF975 family protein n=1 Tax=Hespellia stercorisuis DSM 15480 TaxID=1121950 RepID=A0A1M6QD10_9FIRM|nr:DUF975 family protein [Hespellia stercorisuis]SHK18068.1 Protein of unknown function [Hespellia stercorisuis DSM 15480]
MWNRLQLKEQGKVDFKRNYWLCVLVSLILSICMVSSSGGSAGRYAQDHDTTISSTTDATTAGDASSTIFATAILAVASVVALIGIILSIFVFTPIYIGGRRFYLENQFAPGQLNRLGYSFKEHRYGNVVLTMFLKNLFITLWTLLLIVPGIVKGYSYWMMEYILAENPHLDQKRVFEISRQTMNGQKWNTFVLDLSFIPWYILSGITCGIVGLFYVQPYIDATRTRLYAVLRENALQRGIATAEELPGYFPQVGNTMYQ